MPPRHTKSEFAAYLLPAWMVVVIQTQDHSIHPHTELAFRFGRKTKNLIVLKNIKKFLKQLYKKIHKPQVNGKLQQGGEYYAAGVGSAITGRGADLLIIDDPHSEQDAMSRTALERTLRMVYIRTKTTFTTWRQNSFSHDKMEYSRSHRKIN